jgi:hypothetical protein
MSWHRWLREALSKSLNSFGKNPQAQNQSLARPNPSPQRFDPDDTDRPAIVEASGRLKPHSHPGVCGTAQAAPLRKTALPRL